MNQNIKRIIIISTIIIAIIAVIIWIFLSRNDYSMITQPYSDEKTQIVSREFDDQWDMNHIMQYDCNSLTQEDVTRMINHINSTARDGLNGHNPFELASLLLDKFVINQLDLEAIHPDEVTLKPSLLFQSLMSKQLDDTK